jgi:hypothetical protein
MTIARQAAQALQFCARSDTKGVWIVKPSKNMPVTIEPAADELTDYRYDVFISYKRDQFRNAWLHESFVPMFSQLLQEDIAAVCRRQTIGLFFDQTVVPDDKRSLRGIEPGDDWREALREAIKASRCVVCLWSPLYFLSEWCQVEWNSFLERGRVAKQTLVVPMSVHDGESFPPAAQALQAPDFSDYVVIGEGFKKTEEFVLFQQKLKQFSKKVASCVNAAPRFSKFGLAGLPSASASDPSAEPASSASPVGLELVPDVPQQRLT